ncbi:MAG: TolC family protein [Planctomycetes bacterium]|nr:TolC family protein [Planctomycetota bacterium]
MNGRRRIPSVQPRARRRLGGAALATALAAACLAGCATTQDEIAVRETGEIVDGLQAKVRADRDAAKVASAAAAERAASAPRAPRGSDEPVPETVNLAVALRVAAKRNRNILSDREGLVLAAISLRNAQNAIGPRLTGTIRHALADTDTTEGTVRDSVALGATMTLPTGAEASVTADASKFRGLGTGADSAGAASLTAKLSQPLLRGAGYDATHEQLTDAERQALYDVRQFDLTRQELARSVQAAYYDIVSQKQVVRNRGAKLESLEFLRRRSERLFELDRVSEVDKFRAAREYLSAENDLVDARQELDARLDRLKILLGLEMSAKLDVEETIPEPRKVEMQLGPAVEIALLNRLDLMTARDQVEDAERRESIRERDVLPDLRLDLTGTRASDDAHGVRDLTPLARDSYGAGLSLEIPFDRVRERGALRAARIEVSRARRDLSLTEDRVILDVREALRNLRSADSSLKIQEQITASEEKNVKIARLRFEEGTIGNRDLTDALSNLADAQDRLVREKAKTEVARLGLMKAVGTLTIDEDGTWRD